MMLTYTYGSPRLPSKMSTSNELTLLTISMSILDGSNYLVWESQMNAWLRSKGLWQITAGNEKKFPQVPNMESTTIKQANMKARMEWDNKDNQVYGSIILHVNLSVAVLAASSATEMAAWVALRAAFRQTSPSAIFAEFKNAISQKISTANPTLDIMVMNENFQCLTAASVPIPDIVQAMILLNAMPKEYDGIAQCPSHFHNCHRLWNCNPTGAIKVL